MTKLTSSKLTRLAAILATSVALIGAADLANAKGNFHAANNYQRESVKGSALPHFAMKSDHANRKDKSHNDKSWKDKKQKDAERNERKKGCKQITVPTANCGVSAKDPVGNTRPQLPPTKTTGKLPPHDPVGNTHPTLPSQSSNGNSKTVTVSNGVNKIDIPNTPTGLMISSNSPGTITVFNGITSQTFQGGSVTLHGAGVASGATIVQSPGLQTVKLSNGDMSIAVKPMPASAPTQPTAGKGYVPPGVTFADDAKFVGKGLIAAPYTALIGTEIAVGSVGTTVVGTVLGHPFKYTEKFAGSAFKSLEDFYDGL